MLFKEPRSPNGSCLASMQTIHSHPPARTVSIIEPIKQVQYHSHRGICFLEKVSPTLLKVIHPPQKKNNISIMILVADYEKLNYF